MYENLYSKDWVDENQDQTISSLEVTCFSFKYTQLEWQDEKGYPRNIVNKRELWDREEVGRREGGGIIRTMMMITVIRFFFKVEDI